MSKYEEMLSYLVGKHTLDLNCELDETAYTCEQFGVLDFIGLGVFPMIQTMLSMLIELVKMFMYWIFNAVTCLFGCFYTNNHDAQGAAFYFIEYPLVILYAAVYLPVAGIMCVLEVVDTCLRYGIGMPLAYLLSSFGGGNDPSDGASMLVGAGAGAVAADADADVERRYSFEA